MKIRQISIQIILSIIYTFISISWIFLKIHLYLLAIVIPLSLFINIFAGAGEKTIPTKRLKVCNHGVACLIIFSLSTLVSLIFHTYLGICLLPEKYITFVLSVLFSIIIESIVFWNGIISVYCTSVQLGIRTRVVGIICGWIPIAHLFALYKIISTCWYEVLFETEKNIINGSRKAQKICQTKYPILLVHGVFFRDYKHLNYWGRIPAELIRNGAVVYYGEHQSAASVQDSAIELTEKIKYIIEENKCEKVNIIAHSKGGLDCRYAIANGADQYIASLTTINTPHRGCGFADYLLSKISKSLLVKIENTYNSAAKKLGDQNPDFMSSVYDLTAEKCKKFDLQYKKPDGVYCQSVGSELKKATSGKFPLNFSYSLVKYFGGPNDGLVASDSFEWGEKYTYLSIKGKRGISHGDMIDLNRENIPGFDVREFYVNLVAQLKNKGL